MRLLILGTGGMARQHAEEFSAIDGVDVVAGVDVDAERVRAFCAEHNIDHAFTTLDEAIAWGQFDAVSNVTPDRVHFPTTMQCLAAGKHVFCEKPLATDQDKARTMTAAAEKAGLVAMVNLSYRKVPELHKARDLVLSGALGTIKHIEASYLQSWLVQPAWGHWDKEDQWLWRLSSAHGSTGVLGDIGIHIVDFASFGAATDIVSISCQLRTFDKAPGGRIGKYVLDANDSFTMNVGFANGAIGVIHASRWAAGHMNDLALRIYGDKGGLELWHKPHENLLRGCFGDDLVKAEWRDISAAPVSTNYQRFAEAVKTDRTIEPSFRRAAELQHVLDLGVLSHQDQKPYAI